ncbi:g7176 [Coccomyxa elongata]
MFQSKTRVGPAKLVTFGIAGFLAGIILGYIFMGTVHAMLQLRQEATPGSIAEWTTSTDDIKQSSRKQLPGQSIAKTKGHAATAGIPAKGTTIHTLVTSNGSPYLNFQSRIMYGTYKQVQKMPGGEKLVGFTRILHRTSHDLLMDEVPSFRADPLTPSCDTWCEFPVSDRPNAVMQFLRAAQKDPTMIKAPWLLMIETDYVWMKPLQAPPAENPSSRPMAYPFNYIVPSAPAVEGVMRKMYPAELGPLSNVHGTGPAPVMMRFDEWLEVAPEWERLTAHIEADPESKEKLGWVREMYAFSVAMALKQVEPEILACPQCTLIAQPPADRAIGAAAMFHYTWGTAFKDSFGRKIWEFDKRTYTAEEIQRKTPHIPLPTAYTQGWKLQDDQPVTRELYDTMVAMLHQMNRAVDGLPELQAVS